MTTTKIEVVRDSGKPAGGHAIIRLTGVALLPPGATFRIEPIDDAMLPTAAGHTAIFTPYRRVKRRMGSTSTSARALSTRLGSSRERP